MPLCSIGGAWCPKVLRRPQNARGFDTLRRLLRSAPISHKLDFAGSIATNLRHFNRTTRRPSLTKYYSKSSAIGTMPAEWASDTNCESWEK
jgi:hypothetical protein